VLNAKGGEIKAKATRSATTYGFQNISVSILDFLSKPSYCKKLLSCGGEIWSWGKGEFLVFDQN
jgi:hypothetical protein